VIVEKVTNYGYNLESNLETLIEASKTIEAETLKQAYAFYNNY
jgi:hypothetical protein